MVLTAPFTAAPVTAVEPVAMPSSSFVSAVRACAAMTMSTNCATCSGHARAPRFPTVMQCAIASITVSTNAGQAIV